jgi:tetratricopeptide (TPR) repeat protein
MQIWFCQSCGARVTRADLGNVTGLTATSLVYCKDCIKKETRIDRADDAAKAPQRRRVSTKNVRRKSTGKVAHVVVAPEPEPDPEPEEDEDLRRNRRARHSGSNIPRAASNKIRVAAASGILLLITGVVLVNINLSPEPTRISSPPRQTVDPDADRTRKNDDAPAQQAFNALETRLKGISDSNPKAKLAAIDEFLKQYNDSIVAARARTLRQKYVIADATVAVPVDPLAPHEPPASPVNDKPLPLPMSTKTMPSPVEAHNVRARELMLAGDSNGALEEFNRALKLDPNDLQSLIGRAELHRMRYEFEESLADADRVVGLDKKAWGAVALRAVSAYALGKDTLYKVDFANMQKLMTDLSADYQKYIKTWVPNEAARSRAIYRGRTLEKRGAKTGEDYYIVAYYYFQVGQYKEAEEFGLKALKLDPETLIDEEIYSFLCTLAEIRKDYKQKMEWARAWAEARPKSYKAQNNYAWELLAGADTSLHDPVTGLAIAERAVEADPKRAESLDTLALGYFNNNMVLKAIETEKKSIALLSADEDQTLYTQHLEQYEFAKPPDP